jgi:hypothetical protein
VGSVKGEAEVEKVLIKKKITETVNGVVTFLKQRLNGSEARAETGKRDRRRRIDGKMMRQ